MMRSYFGVITTLLLLAQCLRAQENITEVDDITTLPTVELVSEEPISEPDFGGDFGGLTTVEPEIPQPPTPTPKPVCHKDLSGNKGLFSTENFPDNYPNNNNCTWTITVPQDNKVQLTFHLLNIEHNARCGWDWVKVRESNGTLLKQVCGYLQQDLVVTSTNHSLTIHFYSDSVIQAAGFLASWVAIPPEDQENEVTETLSDKDEPGYMLSFPQSFTTKNSDAPEENLCLQLINVKNDGKAEVRFYNGENLLMDKPSIKMSIPYIADDPNQHLNCFKMQLPEEFKAGTAILRVNGTYGNYNILSYKTVRVIKSSTLSLIQSDKFDYRPKQDVKFRVMLLDAELKPSQKVEIIQEVWISDPADNRLKQWKDIETKHGIYQFSMKLDDEPALGKWHITAKFGSNGTQEEKVSFTVSENVLPKFEVNVDSPPVVYRNTVEQKFEICATYTHGGKVKGSVNTTFYVDYKDSYWSAPPKKIEISKFADELVNGCATVFLNNTEILKLAEKSPELKIIAVATEAVTGTKQNVTEKTNIEDTEFVIDFGGSSAEHIVAPGSFPYVGRVKAIGHAKTPLSNIKLQICTRLFTSLDKMRSYVNRQRFYNFIEDQFYEVGINLTKIKYKEQCDEYTTNDGGVVDFSVKLQNIPTNVTRLNIKVAAADYVNNSTNGMKQPTKKLDVSLTHANASSALTIHNVKEGSELECSMNKIPVYFSAKPDSTVMLAYYFTSSGSIVEQGSQKVQVLDQDMSSEYVGSANNITFFDNLEDNDNAEVVTKFEINLKLPLENGNQGRISNKLKLLVYSRDEDGNILTSSQEFSTAYCNEATAPKISWSSAKLSPSSDVTFKIQANSAAYCGYSIIDKSVNLVANPNKVTKPKLQGLKEDLAKLRVVNSQVPDRCTDASLVFKSFERMGLFVLSDKLLENTDCDTLVDVTAITKRRDNSYIPGPSPLSASLDYAEYGGVEDCPDCQNDVVQPASFQASVAAQSAPSFSEQKNRISASDISSNEERPSINKPKVELRNYFPETWLFDLVELNSDGETELSLKTPDTITTWVAEAICTDSTHGMKVSEEANLLVSQDFFADLNMPYSIKRGEQFPLNVSVFNTIKQNLPIKLSLKASDQYKFGRPSHLICLHPEDNHIETFTVKASELHQVNITVEAKISSSDKSGCNDDIGDADGYADVIQKPIQVKPEGFSVEKVESEFVCRKTIDDETNLNMQPLELPDKNELVNGSARAWTTVTGDIMAPALTNLDKLLQQPTGCGEQNMLGMVPNIYLLKYLQGKGVSVPAIESKAKKYMKIGYEREQTYRFPDGSYSVWGPKTDKEGSMWLTSFVVKAFVQASQHIPIDKRNVEESMNWILKQQGEDGCFQNKGYALHQELKGNQISLTASVLVTLIEAKHVFRQNDWGMAGRLDIQVEKAYECVKQNISSGDDNDMYLKSIVTYASTLYSDNMNNNNSNLALDTTSEQLLTGLISVGNTSLPGKLFWTTGENNRARDVEITAYNVLSLTLKNKLSEALQAIRWLATNRNSYGGFVSTQDTMIALQAIAEYSLKISNEENDLAIDVNIGTVNTVKNFKVDEDNKLLLQKIKVDELTSRDDVTVKASGNGCFMVQTVLRYNVQTSPNKQAFLLNVTQEGDDLTVCASHTESKETDMVVIEIELLSGYTPYLKSLENLRNIEVNNINYQPVKKYEYDEKEGKVVLYFDQMPKEVNCYDMNLKKSVDVTELKPAIATIYDYYNSKSTFSTSYTIE